MPNSFQKLYSAIPISELENNKQSNTISLQKWVDLHILTNVGSLSPKDAIIAKSLQWDSDWETVDTIEENGIVVAVHKGWTISIGQINQFWLARFSVELIFKKGTQPFLISESTLFKKNVGWIVQDVVGKETSNLKNIALVAGIYSQFSNHPLFDVKLLVKYINQSNRD